jgi:hypothetical protein
LMEKGFLLVKKRDNRQKCQSLCLSARSVKLKAYNAQRL